MKKPYFYILFICLFSFLIGINVLALSPTIIVRGNPSSVELGQSVSFSVTVESNYRLRNNEVEIFWKDGTRDTYSCSMSANYAAPPQTCSFSAQHTYANEGDFSIQISARTTEPATSNQTITVSVTSPPPPPPPPIICGNGTIDTGETCDDGNTASGDGCSSSCQTEGGGGPTPIQPPTQTGSFESNAFISEINPTNLLAGQTVNGTIGIRVTCFRTSVMGTPFIDFGEGAGFECVSISTGEDANGNIMYVCPLCTCDSNPEDTEEKIVDCTYPFSHTYNTAGTFLVSPQEFNTGSIGLSETVTVSAVPPAPTPGGGSGINPLEAMTAAELVNTIVDVVFYILTSLAVALVIFGGITIITAAGSPTQLTKGKQIIIYTIIGYALILAARGIVGLVFQVLDVSTTTT